MTTYPAEALLGTLAPGTTAALRSSARWRSPRCRAPCGAGDRPLHLGVELIGPIGAAGGGAALLTCLAMLMAAQLLRARRGAPAPQAAAGRGVPAVRAASASTRASPATSPPATRSDRPLLGQPVRHGLRPASGCRTCSSSTTTARSSRATRPVNRAAFAIHSQVHAARPDVGRRRALALAVRQGVVGARPHARPDHPGRLRLLRGPRAVRRLHRRRARHRGGRPHRRARSASDKAAILRNHGLLTVGHTVDEAAWWFITMERCCQAQLLAEAAGTPVPIDDETAAGDRRARSAPTSPAGSASSRSTSGSSREQPDLLDLISRRA